MSDLCIMLLTYDRLEYAIRTLHSVGHYLKYTRGKIVIHLASDGDTAQYMKALLDEALSTGKEVTSSNSNRKGYGANYNLATQTVHQIEGVRYVLPLEDDWECLRELDLDHLTRALDTGPFGCIRLGYLGWTQELRGTLVSADAACFMALHSDSPEPHVFAGHPRIETVEWERAVGPWPEGLEPGATEFAVAHNPFAREGVAWPLEVDPRPGCGMFAHIGTERAPRLEPVASSVVA